MHFLKYFFGVFLFLYCGISVSAKDRISSKKRILSEIIEKELKQARGLRTIDRKASLKLAESALKKAMKLNDLNLVGSAQNLFGDVMWYEGDYQTASRYYFKALKNFELTKNDVALALCYRNIGWIYLGEKKYKKAEKYFLESSNRFKSLDLKSRYIISLDDLGNLYLTSGELSKALVCCKKAVKIANAQKDTSVIGTSHGTIASIYYKMGNKAEAMRNYQVSLKWLNQLNSQVYNKCLANLGMGELYVDLKRNDLALMHVKTAILLATKGDYKKELTSAYLLASKVYGLKNDFKTAHEMSTQYAALKDSLHAFDNKNFIEELENKHKLKQDRLKIQNLEQKAKLNQLNLAKEQAFKIYFIFILGLIAVFGLFVWRAIIKKKKSNLELQKAYHIIEEKNKDISDSIDYAKHIQQARLPVLDTLKNDFEDVFVFYEPRDIVSGDFYWHDKSEDGTIFFACADCTGHGIPGAFMSMMGIDGFNYAILEKKLRNPGDVLTLVNRFIKDSLNQNDELAKSKDGMDVALIAINPDRSELIYSGANRPLFVIRDGLLLEYKPNKLSIGGNHLMHYQFHHEIIHLRKNDQIYLFSDGYVDQFGGPDGKKFMTKQFKSLLLQIANESMNTQQDILRETFEKWKNSQTQIDDLLVVGLKV